MGPAQHRSSATPLAMLYAALVAYASLYPFDGWRLSTEGVLDFVALPWPRWWTGFDLVANFAGYVPLGALIFGAYVRSGQRPKRAMAGAWLLASLLSLATEMLQNLLPQRVASNVDLLFNSVGAAAGVAVAFVVHKRGWVDRWQSVRDRCFIDRSAGGLALLVLWPVGLLFPTPVALGLGRGLPRIHEPLSALLEGTPIAHWLRNHETSAPDLASLSPIAEMSTIVLGLLAPCLVAFTIARPGWPRLALVGALVTLGFLTTTLSTALNFGPEHGLAWLTSMAMVGFGVGVVLAIVAGRLPGPSCIGLGLVVLTALIVAVAQAPEDPYFSQSLHAWEQGDFIRFHGAAQWIGWLWPFLGLIYLLLRAGMAAQTEAAGTSAPRMPP
jgi:VanZ family protein